MNTYKYKKVLSISLLTAITIGTVSFADSATVKNYLNSLRTTDSWYVWYILSEIFWTSWDTDTRIKEEFLDKRLVRTFSDQTIWW